jgi:hypothetical protein
MQKVPNFPFGLSPSPLDEAFQRAHAELGASERTVATEVATSAAEDRAADDFPDRLIMGHELLLEVREPIEWLLALVRRLATGDPDDVAAIDRITAAFHSRLACGGLGVRVADMLTGFGILVGALDPGVVLEAASKTIADGVATILSYEGAVFASHLERLAEAMPAVVHRACPRSRRKTRANHTR